MDTARLASLYFDAALAWMGATGNITLYVTKLHALELLMDARVGEATRFAVFGLAVEEYDRSCASVMVGCPICIGDCFGECLEEDWDAEIARYEYDQAGYPGPDWEYEAELSPHLDPQNTTHIW